LPDVERERSFLAMPNPLSFRYFKTSHKIIQLAGVAVDVVGHGLAAKKHNR